MKGLVRVFGAMALVAALVGCDGALTGPGTPSGEPVVAPDGTVAPPGTVIEDDFAPDSLPVTEGIEVTLEGTLAYETYEHKGTVECLILVLDEPFDASFGSYPHEDEPELHKAVTCVDVSSLLFDGGCDASVAGSHVRVRGTFAGSSKFSGAHYDETGALQINGGATLRDPVLVE